MESRTGKHHAAAPQHGAPRPRDRQVKHGWSRERFCEYLVAQRDRASLSIEDIAKVTKIPERSLRQLEEGKFEALPADVFVRGFLRSYARCVGVDADELIRRYSQCGGLEPPPVASDFARTAAEQLKAMAQRDGGGQEVGVVRAAAPVEATPVAVAEIPAGLEIEPEASADADERATDEQDDDDDTAARPDSEADGEEASLARTAPAPVRTHGKRRRKSKGQRRHRGGERPAPVAAQPTEEVEAAPVAVPAERSIPATARHEVPRQDEHADDVDDDESIDAEPAVAAVAPRRETARQRAFLPPAWSEGEEGNRRGPLTLAVIILVIVATLTMSYLLRRPSYSGDGVTALPPAAGQLHLHG